MLELGLFSKQTNINKLLLFFRAKLELVVHKQISSFTVLDIEMLFHSNQLDALKFLYWSN